MDNNLNNNEGMLTTKDLIIRYGLIAGGVSIVFTAILYVVDPKLLFGAVALIGSGMMIVICILGAIRKKSLNGGTISYGETVVISISSFSIAQTLSTVALLMLYLVIDTDLISKYRNYQMAKMDELYEKHIFTKAAYDKAINALRDMNGNSILKNFIIGLFLVIVLVLIIFLITSIFVKKDSPFKNTSI